MLAPLSHLLNEFGISYPQPPHLSQRKVTMVRLLDLARVTPLENLKYAIRVMVMARGYSSLV